MRIRQPANGRDRDSSTTPGPSYRYMLTGHGPERAAVPCDAPPLGPRRCRRRISAALLGATSVPRLGSCLGTAGRIHRGLLQPQAQARDPRLRITAGLRSRLSCCGLHCLADPSAEPDDSRIKENHCVQRVEPLLELYLRLGWRREPWWRWLPRRWESPRWHVRQRGSHRRLSL